jgi:hypothetical protein
VSHVGFGLVLGEDGKKFKTRSGDVVRLVELLDEAKTRCRDSIRTRREEVRTGHCQTHSFEAVDCYVRAGMHFTRPCSHDIYTMYMVDATHVLNSCRTCMIVSWHDVLCNAYVC